MFVTASWGGADVAVEVDAECRSVAALKRCVQEALPELDVETVRLEVGGRSVDDEEVLGLSEGSVIDISATPAAMLREEGHAVTFDGFCCAAKQGDLRVCRLYLDAAVVWDSWVDTPLHIAVSDDRRELLELLLGAGCDKDATGQRCTTPLHLAIDKQNLELVKILLDAGCDTEAETDFDSLPLHRAIDEQNLELATLLIDAGCDKDAQNPLGATPLHRAIDEQNTELAKLLLDAGCDTEQAGVDSLPLHRAIDEQNTELVKLLIDAGCDKEADYFGDTPLHRAIDKQNTELVKLLIDAGCNTRAKNSVGNTPLQQASDRGHELVGLLRRASALDF